MKRENVFFFIFVLRKGKGIWNFDVNALICFLFFMIFVLCFVSVLSSSAIGRCHTEGSLPSGLLSFFDLCLDLSYNHSSFDEIYFPTIHFFLYLGFCRENLSCHFSTSKKKKIVVKPLSSLKTRVYKLWGRMYISPIIYMEYI